MSYYPPVGLGPERAQHIEDMLRHPMLTQCRAVGPDGSTFDTPLYLAEGRSTNLRVSLPPSFPVERPTITVLAPVQHPAVDSSGRVLTQQVLNWKHPFSRLVTTVVEAHQALSGRPADFRSQPSPPHHGPSPPHHAPSTSRPPSAASSMPMSILPPSGGPSPSPPSTSPQPHARPPPPPGPFGGIPPPHPQEVTALVRAELQGKAPSELRSLLDGNSPQLQALLKTVIRKSQAAQAVDAARQAVCDAARGNLAMEGALAEARQQVAVVRGSELEVHKASYDALVARQAEVVAALGPARVLGAMEEALSAADHRADELKDAVRAGDVPLEKFLEQYIAVRKEYHALSLKQEVAAALLPAPPPC